MKKTNLSLIGFLQAWGVVAYCALVSGLFWSFNEFNIAPPRVFGEFFGAVLVLILLVFSAAVSGSIVFGYPAYLALNGKIKQGISVVFYTLLYCIGIVCLAIVALVLIL